MSKDLYMIEMEQLLEELSRVATEEGKSTKFYGLKTWTRKKLIQRFGLTLEDADGCVAAACGEEP